MFRDNLFMITCAARTGSTLLTSYLQSHPDILCHGEIYAPSHVNDLLGRYSIRNRPGTGLDQALLHYRNTHPYHFLYKIAWDTQGRKVAGFKLKHDELVQPRMARVRHIVQEDQDIKIIHLRRQNSLARYLSWYVVNHVTGVTMRLEGQEIPVVKPVRLQPLECLANFEETDRQYSFFQKLFTGHPIYEVSYEELVSQRSQTILAEIQAFLGISQQVMTTRMLKLSSDNLNEAIENFDELKDFFKGTKYASFFE
ncbi:MAG: sulfotransferase [Elainella sp. Prado103]|nr:sulfotransferase [Elainella sp. Prado103]